MQENQVDRKDLTQPYSWKTKATQMVNQIRLKQLAIKQNRLEQKQIRTKIKNKKHKAQKLIMSELDEDIVDFLVAKLMKKRLKKADYSKYGTANTLKYYKQVHRLEVVEKICRRNGWTTAEDWKQRKVDMNKYFVDLFKTMKEHSVVKMYYEKAMRDRITRASKR